MTNPENLQTFISQYREDERSGVMKLVETAKKRLSDFEKEKERTYEMQKYERMYENCRYICGIDEVGRGPLAGPVVAAAVILPKDVDIYYLNDSKQLSEKKRESLYDEIMEKAIAVGIGFADEKCIDEINILQADYVAMRIALSQLSVTPDVLLNDAVIIPEVDIKQEKHARAGGDLPLACGWLPGARAGGKPVRGREAHGLLL